MRVAQVRISSGTGCEQRRVFSWELKMRRGGNHSCTGDFFASEVARSSLLHSSCSPLYLSPSSFVPSLGPFAVREIDRPALAEVRRAIWLYSEDPCQQIHSMYRRGRSLAVKNLAKKLGLGDRPRLSGDLDETVPANFSAFVEAGADSFHMEAQWAAWTNGRHDGSCGKQRGSRPPPAAVVGPGHARCFPILAIKFEALWEPDTLSALSEFLGLGAEVMATFPQRRNRTQAVAGNGIRDLKHRKSVMHKRLAPSGHSRSRILTQGHLATAGDLAACQTSSIFGSLRYRIQRSRRSQEAWSC